MARHLKSHLLNHLGSSLSCVTRIILGHWSKWAFSITSIFCDISNCALKMRVSFMRIIDEYQTEVFKKNFITYGQGILFFHLFHECTFLWVFTIDTKKNSIIKGFHLWAQRSAYFLWRFLFFIQFKMQHSVLCKYIDICKGKMCLAVTDISHQFLKTGCCWGFEN